MNSNKRVMIDRLEGLMAGSDFSILLFARLRNFISQDEPRDHCCLTLNPECGPMDEPPGEILLVTAEEPWDYPHLGADFVAELRGNSERRSLGLPTLTRVDRDLLGDLGWTPPKRDRRGRGRWLLVPEEDSEDGLMSFAERLIETFSVVWEKTSSGLCADFYRHQPADGDELVDWDTQQDEKFEALVRARFFKHPQ